MKFSADLKHIHQALRNDFVEAQRQDGFSAQMFNVEFGHSETSSWFYQVLEGRAAMPLTQLTRFIELTGGRHVLGFLLSKGGFLPPIPYPENKVSAADLADITRRFAAVLDAWAAGEADGVWDFDEKASLRAKANFLVVAVLSFVEMVCEE